MRHIFIVIAFIKSTLLMAQDSTALYTFKVDVYAEIYFSYDMNKPVNNNRPGFFYNHNRHKEINLNLGFVKLAYARERVRANFAMAAGTYMHSNYVAEPSGLKNILEANAGIKISKKKNLWVDAGIFSSHLGFESAISKDCWTVSRSLLAENSPYFESGAKLTYTSNNEKWILSGLLLNGWQRIKKVDGNSAMSYGTQLQFKPGSKSLYNYSTFIGTDKPDSNRCWRYFHNFYGLFDLTQKWGLTAGVDIGSEQKNKGSKALQTWYSTVFIVKYAFSKKYTVAARGEYYSDPREVIVVSGTPNGFQTSSFSFNVDYRPFKNALVRLEARWLHSRDKIFEKKQAFQKDNTFITTSLALWF